MNFINWLQWHSAYSLLGFVSFLNSSLASESLGFDLTIISHCTVELLVLEKAVIPIIDVSVF